MLKAKIHSYLWHLRYSYLDLRTGSCSSWRRWWWRRRFRQQLNVGRLMRV